LKAQANDSIHSCALAGHIEDIAVAKSEQGKKLGIKIIHTLMDISEKVGCYKTTLVCADHNVKFYERCGFVKGQNEMVRSSLQLPGTMLMTRVESILREEGTIKGELMSRSQIQFIFKRGYLRVKVKSYIVSSLLHAMNQA
jgi:hypothetical protein